MTTLTMRLVKGDFIVTGPDVEPMKFKSRREAKDWCKSAGRRATRGAANGAPTREHWRAPDGAGSQAGRREAQTEGPA